MPAAVACTPAWLSSAPAPLAEAAWGSLRRLGTPFGLGMLRSSGGAAAPAGAPNVTRFNGPGPPRTAPASSQHRATALSGLGLPLSKFFAAPARRALCLPRLFSKAGICPHTRHPGPPRMHGLATCSFDATFALFGEHRCFCSWSCPSPRPPCFAAARPIVARQPLACHAVMTMLPFPAADEPACGPTHVCLPSLHPVDGSLQGRPS